MDEAPASTTSPGVFWPIALSLLLGLAALALLVAADPWKVLAVSRVLDPLIEGGIVQYHDRQPGFIAGVPLPKYYFWSQEAVDWRLVGVSAVLMMLYPAIKAIQFSAIARAYGSRSTFKSHVSAYIYGDGLNRFLPFDMGMVGTANCLVADGLDRERATAAVMASRLFTVFEICMFGLLGLLLLGWSNWLSHTFWALVVLAVAYHFVSSPGQSVRVVPSDILSRRTPVMLPARPLELAAVAAPLSLLAFGTIDLAIYILMAAFDTTVLAISVDPSVLLMAIVGGYIAARIIPITPGGIGQWEIGFAATFLLADTDISIPLLCIGLLANTLRIVTGLTLLAIVSRTGEIKTHLSEVLAESAGGQNLERHSGNGHAPDGWPDHRIEHAGSSGLATPARPEAGE